MVNYISNITQNAFSHYRPEGSIIDTAIITYSAVNGSAHRAMGALYRERESAHYFVAQHGLMTQLHNEQHTVFYNGNFYNNSIIVMLVNNAKTPFLDEQMESLVSLLNDINVRHETTMNVVGLGEVSPYVEGRINSFAPGACFNWTKLSEAGMSKSVSIPENISHDCKINIGDSGDNVNTLQQQLQTLGYSINISGSYDNQTAFYVKNFENHYLNQNICNNQINFAQSTSCWSDAHDYAVASLNCAGEMVDDVCNV